LDYSLGVSCGLLQRSLKCNGMDGWMGGWMDRWMVTVSARQDMASCLNIYSYVFQTASKCTVNTNTML